MFRQFYLPMFAVMLSVLAAFCPAQVYAQDRSGVLQGVVKDASGAPAAGAFVKMKNGERRLTFMVVTQAWEIFSGGWATSNC